MADAGGREREGAATAASPALSHRPVVASDVYDVDAIDAVGAVGAVDLRGQGIHVAPNRFATLTGGELYAALVGPNGIRGRAFVPETLSQFVERIAVHRHFDLLRVEYSWIVGLDVSGRRVQIVLAPGVLRCDSSLSADVDVACTQDTFIDVVSGRRTVDAAYRIGALDVVGTMEPVRSLFALLRPYG